MSSHRSALADGLGRSILSDEDGNRLDPTRTEDHLAIVTRASEAEGVARELLNHAVIAARSGGHSWAAIGSALGLSRQAVQQRFGRLDEESVAEGYRWLGPVTAFDEMAELDLAGEMGWHTVQAGMLRHKMVRTDTQWEHRRVVWKRPVAHYLRDGWQVGCRAFPWLYLIRDRGMPPLATVAPDRGEVESH